MQRPSPQQPQQPQQPHTSLELVSVLESLMACMLILKTEINSLTVLEVKHMKGIVVVELSLMTNASAVPGLKRNLTRKRQLKKE